MTDLLYTLLYYAGMLFILATLPQFVIYLKG
jgi:hypothetical protein